jgi:probable rRNA maturation factor
MVIFETTVSDASTPGVSTGQLHRFVRRAQTLAKVKGEVDILISDNTRLRDLNHRFRHKNKPTDVLSFPRPSGGDIAISADIALENAHRYGHSIAEEIKILVLHGMLHLAGYDHEADNGRMARTEARLRSQLKLPASLIDRMQSGGKPALKAAAAANKTITKNSRLRVAVTRRPRAARRRIPQ